MKDILRQKSEEHVTMTGVKVEEIAQAELKAFKNSHYKYMVLEIELSHKIDGTDLKTTFKWQSYGSKMLMGLRKPPLGIYQYVYELEK